MGLQVSRRKIRTVQWVSFTGKTICEVFENAFHGESFRESAVTQCTMPTCAVCNCLKIFFLRRFFANLQAPCPLTRSVPIA